MLRVLPLWVYVRIATVVFLMAGATAQEPASAAKNAKSSCPDWAAEFDKVDDPNLLHTLRAHRETGWDAVVQEGEKLGVSLSEQIADGERQLQVSRGAEQRAGSGLSSRRSARDGKPPDCSKAEEQEHSFTCQAHLRHNEVLALEGMLDLLRCRLRTHPNPPHRPEGTPIAIYQIVVTPAAKKAGSDAADANCPCDEQKAYSHARNLGMEQNGQTIEVEQGSYLVLRFDTKDHAAGFTQEPEQGVLQYDSGVFLPRNVVGILKAKAPGKSKIVVFSRGEPRVANGRREENATSVKFANQLSNNWAGYAKIGGPFEFVRGEWNVPTIDSTVAGDMAVWVGIDGSSNNSLIQAGTFDGYWSGFLGIGQGVAHSAWWEILPALPAFLSNPVSSGDTMVTTISPLPGLSADPSTTNSWVISIKNTTRGWTFSTLASFNGPLTSAEWIVEDLSRCFGSCSFDPLPNFGNVNFDRSNLVATGTAAPAPPVLTTDDSIAAAPDSTIAISPSDPDCGMDGFSVVPGPNAPSPPGPFFTNTSLPEGYVGVPYHTRLFVSGLVEIAPFTEGITLSQSSPPLPPGLTLDEQNGEITGTPTVAGTFPFKVHLDDFLDDFNMWASCTASTSIKISPSFRRRCIYSKTTHSLICF